MATLAPLTGPATVEVRIGGGAGGMGEVYRAHDPRLDRDVAVKVLPSHLSGNASALARFEREAKVLAALSHPNILAVFDVGSENGVSFVVMELLPGQTLFSRIAKRRLDWPDAVRMGIEIADGLSAALSKGTIHRDLKPENIFLTRDGHVKILDFGLACWVHDFKPGEAEFAATAGPATATGVVMGTAPYMPPEQLKGMHVDARADIFSFGCVLHEAITGHSPFVRPTAAETVSAILSEAPPALKAFDAAIPGDLDEVVKRCLNKEPDQRFQSAGDLAFHLRQILAVSAPSATTQVVRRVEPFHRRSVQAVAAALVLLLFSAFAHWIGTRSRVAHPTFKKIAVVPLQNLSADPEQRYFVDGMTDAVITDLAKIRLESHLPHIGDTVPELEEIAARNRE